MILTAHKAKLTTSTTTEYDIRLFGGVYIYVDYVPGAETSIAMTFKVADKRFKNPEEMFNILSSGSTIYSITLIEGKNVYPLPVPESADYLEITFTPTGDDEDAQVSVFVNGDLAIK